MKYKGYRFSIRWLNGGKFLRVHLHRPNWTMMEVKQRSLPLEVSNKRKQLRPHMDALLAVVMLEE